MKFKQLGRTGINVSDLCLGSMTYGTQTSQADAHVQIDTALAAGINFIDTAEMYPVNPISKETVGRTEEVIGNWFASTARRDEVIIATKHSGIGFAHARDGAAISARTIPEAIEGSLKRLQTDVIDLYQFHWPNRGSYMFRQNWSFDPSGQDREATQAHMVEALEALQAEVKRGTIRHFGLSNESAWGMAEWLRIADETGGPRAASVQNEYSMMCRMYDTDLAELSVNEDVGLLAFSPLAVGMLSGKYQNGVVPEDSRLAFNGDLGGRKSDRAFAAVDAYVEIAQKHGVDPVHMALSWCRSRAFMGSVIFGARTQPQLEHALAAADITLSDEVLAEIDQAHQRHPMPF